MRALATMIDTIEEPFDERELEVGLVRGGTEQQGGGEDEQS